jgi:hypothetical protein
MGVQTASMKCLDVYCILCLITSPCFSFYITCTAYIFIILNKNIHVEFMYLLAQICKDSGIIKNFFIILGRNF